MVSCLKLLVSVLEVTLNGPGARKHGYLPLSKKDRRFFPGYKIPFVLETDIGEIRTQVAGGYKKQTHKLVTRTTVLISRAISNLAMTNIRL